jgi:co-chaperonin GroES (HSP10)
MAPPIVVHRTASAKAKSASQRHNVVIVGHAITGEMNSSKAKLECGHIVLGSSYCATVSITNPTLALIKYQLQVDTPSIKLERTEVCLVFALS